MTRTGTVEKPLSPGEVVADIEQWEGIFQIADETEEVTRILVELMKEYDIKGGPSCRAYITSACPKTPVFERSLRGVRNERRSNPLVSGFYESDIKY